jgi:nitroreductase
MAAAAENRDCGRCKMPLMQVLRERRSRRAFSSRKLPEQLLANLLWAAAGINEPDSGKRTAPSAVNWQEIDLYVAMPEGTYLYDARAHALIPVLAEDIRALTGIQRFTQEAPLNLIYVADRSRMGRASEAQKDFYSATDTGFISQNVYLFCASEGLSTVVLGMLGKSALEKKLRLRPQQKVILTQPVGFPKE